MKKQIFASLRDYHYFPIKRSFSCGCGIIFAIFLTCSKLSLALSPNYQIYSHRESFVGAVSQSELNHNLDASDQLFASNGHIFRVGADGKPRTQDDSRIRLYGVSLSLGANFPTDEDGRAIARRLRSLGINAVRLHHLDTNPDATPKTNNSILLDGPYPKLNPSSTERLRKFIQTLKSEGIYVNLNLFVGYRFRPEIDGVPMLASSNTEIASNSPVSIFQPEMIASQVKLAQKLIENLGLNNNSVLAMVEVRNEASLASTWQDWQTTQWSQSIQGAYAKELTRQWNVWLESKYGGFSSVCKRWLACDKAEQVEFALPTPEEADILRTGRAGTWSKAIDRLLIWLDRAPAIRKWVDTVIKVNGSKLRLEDFSEFLISVDRKYFEIMRSAVQTATGTETLVTGTQMYYGGAMNLLSHKAMDYIDEHFYIDHYQFPNTLWDPLDWRIKDSSIVDGEIRNLTNLARYRDLSKPFVVSEYNQAYPNRRGAEILPTVAAFAAAQDWDALFFFDYIDGKSWTHNPSGFTLAGDWSKLALVGQSARLFRLGLVPSASSDSVWTRSYASIIDIGAFRKRERRGLSDAEPLAWTADRAFQERHGIRLAPESGLPAADPKPAVSSATKYSEEQGQLYINTQQLAAYIGRVNPGQKFDLSSLSFEILDTKKDFVNLMVSTLDGQSFSQSSRLLLSIPGYVFGSQNGSLPLRAKSLIPYQNNSDWKTLQPDMENRNRPSGSLDAKSPLWMERIPVKLTLPINGKTVMVYPLTLEGNRLPALPSSAISQSSGLAVIQLQQESQPVSPWYELVMSASPAPFAKH